MIIAIAATLVVLLALTLVVVVAADPGSPPTDVALAYEQAWDTFDFESLWTLSGDELRDGLDRRAFVQAKREAYADRPELGNLARDVAVEHVNVVSDLAIVRTRVALREGGTTANEVDLAKRSGRWLVVSYQLEPVTRPDDRAGEASPRSGA